MVARSQTCSKARPDASPLKYYFTFCVMIFQIVIGNLRIQFDIAFWSPSSGFPKASIIDYEKIKTLAEKISGVFTPSFYTSGIAFKIKNYSFAFR